VVGLVINRSQVQRAAMEFAGFVDDRPKKITIAGKCRSWKMTDQIVIFQVLYSEGHLAIPFSCNSSWLWASCSHTWPNCGDAVCWEENHGPWVWW